jgi:RHS repeat-associated protein
MDGMGRRVGKKVGGILQKAWIYRDALNPVAELDGAGNVVSVFVYGTKSHVPDYMVKGGNTYRFVTDQLGSVRLVVKVSDGSIAQRIDYDEWGNATLQAGTWGFQPFGYAGGLYDPDTGLVRFGARDYDPETGRWTAKDPIGFGGGQANLYLYVGGDPINFIDPSGRTSDALNWVRWVRWLPAVPALPVALPAIGGVAGAAALVAGGVIASGAIFHGDIPIDDATCNDPYRGPDIEPCLQKADFRQCLSCCKDRFKGQNRNKCTLACNYKFLN